MLLVSLLTLTALGINLINVHMGVIEAGRLLDSPQKVLKQAMDTT